jgi:MscS family membrane protein
MDFLHTIYFDNTIQTYIEVCGTILVILLLKRFLSRYIASLLYVLISRIWKNVGKKEFIDLVVIPLQWFLFFLISILSIAKLNFPRVLEFTVYGVSSEDIFAVAGKFIIVLSFFGLLLRFIDFIALLLGKRVQLTEDKRDNQLIVFFRDFFKVVFFLIGILVVLKVCFNQHIGNLLTGLSLVGAAMALAAKESLENLIASFIIFFDKPFFTGDQLKINNVTGTVEKIGLRSTSIRTIEKTLVTVPNKQMVDNIVDNQSLRTNRRAEIKLELATTTSLPNTTAVIDGLKEIIAKNDQHISSSSVFFKEINKNGLTIVVEYFTVPFALAEFDGLKEKINLAIKKLLEDNTIEMAGQTSTIIIDNSYQ